MAMDTFRRPVHSGLALFKYWKGSFVCLLKSDTLTMFLFNKASEEERVRFAARATKRIKLMFYSLPNTRAAEQFRRQTLV